MANVKSDFVSTRHPVYVIFSSRSLDELHTTLSRYGHEEDIHLLKVEYDRQGQDTNRTLAILGSSFSGIQNKDNLGFRIQKFELRNQKPYETQTLCITLPKDLGLKAMQISDVVHDKLQVLIDSGIITEKDFKFNIPLKNRELDLPKASCYLCFEKTVDGKSVKTVDDETLKVVRSVLYRSSWPKKDPDDYDEKKIFFFVFPLNNKTEQ